MGAFLASDGLIRLVDVFRLYTALDLFAAARQDGSRAFYKGCVRSSLTMFEDIGTRERR